MILTKVKNKSILIFLRNLILFFFLVYFAQGAFYPNGSIISQGALFSILLISIYFFLKTVSNKTNYSLFYISWTSLLFINVLGYIFSTNYSTPFINTFGMFKKILLVLLPFYPFLYMTKKGIITDRFFQYFLLFILPITIIQFIHQESVLQNQNDVKNVVNNMAYGLVTIIPLTFFFKKKLRIIGFISIIVIMYYIILGAKRGALLSGILGLIIFFYYQYKSLEKKYKLIGSIILTISIYFISYTIYDFILSNEYMMNRFAKLSSDGDGISGRDIIYEAVFNGWYNSESIFNLVFGYGFAASIKFAGNFAHNDWLELLSNFGIIGIVIYLLVFTSAISYLINKKNSKDNKFLVLLIFSLLFLSTVFSMGYTSSSSYIYSIVLGYIYGSKNLKKCI